MADKSISYRFLGKDDGLGRTMGNLGDKTEKLHSQFGKLAGAFAGGLVAGKGIDLLRDGINDASDLSESLSKTRVVFGESSKAVEAFAKAAATGIGQSQQEALEATSTFGNLFTALGIGSKPAADLSTRVVKLAGDLASFNNVDPAEALDALKSGLLGEAEPMRKFGVTLSATRVQAEAMADGLVKPVKDGGKVRTALLNVEVATRKLAEAQKGHGTSTVGVQVATKKLAEAQKKYGAGSLEAKVANERLTKANQALSKSQREGGPHSLAARVAADKLAKANEALAKATKGNVPELTAAQKAQASYNIIMKDTKNAQGDFARTSGGLANQQRILKAEWKDASATLGTKLLPIATKVTTALTKQLEPGSDFRDILADLGGKAKDFDSKARPIFTFVGDHPDMFKKIAADAVILGGALKAKSFITGMGLLKGLTGGSAVTGAGGALGKVGSPVPVYVTNKGFGGPGSKIPTVVKTGAAAGAGATARTLASVVAGPVGVSAALTAGDSVQLPGFSKDKNAFAKTFQTKHAGTEWSDAQQNAMRAALGFKGGKSHAANNAAPLDRQAAINYLLRYGGGSQEARTWLNKLGFRVPASGGIVPRSVDELEDPRRARAYTQGLVEEKRQAKVDTDRLVKALTSGTNAKPSIVMNHPQFNGIVDVNAFTAEIARQNRVAALGNRVPGAGRLGQAGV